MANLSKPDSTVDELKKGVRPGAGTGRPILKGDANNGFRGAERDSAIYEPPGVR